MHPRTRPLRSLLILLCAAFAPAVTAFSNSDRPTVVCTVGMVADVARAVAGDHAEVTTLIGPGVDPHLHKPTRSDIARLMNADLIVAVGLHLEGRMEETLERAANSGRTVVQVGDLLPIAL